MRTHAHVVAALAMHAIATLGYGATGGPDGFGYTFIDSDEPSGPDFEWIDISSNGAVVVASGDNSSSETPPVMGIGSSVELGAPVRLYGQTLTKAVPAANGYISFEPGHLGGDFDNDCLLPAVPSHGTGARIYPFHDDLTLAAVNARVLHQYFDASPHPHHGGGVSIFTWENAAFAGGGGPGTLSFQTLLFDNGDIVFQYQTAGPSFGDSATVGIQSDGGTNGLGYGCDTAGLVTNELAILFEPPTVTVNTFQDQFDTPSGAQVSLREALRDVPAGGKINFSALLFPIDLSAAGGGQGNYLTVDKPISIDGGALSDPVTITEGTANRTLWIVSGGGAVSIYNIRVSDGPGRGIYVTGGLLKLDRCEIELHGNSAMEISGAVTVTVSRCEIHSNSSGSSLRPGGILANNAVLALRDSTLRWNKGGYGGIGLIDSPAASIRDSDISFNCGEKGGGVYTLRSDVLIERTSLAHNRATIDGGGVYFRQGRLDMRDATLSANEAAANGGGLFLQPFGSPAVATLQHVTIVGNRATTGPGIAAYNSTTTTLDHCVLAENETLSGAAASPIFRQGNPVTSLGYNLVDVTEAIFSGTGDVQNTDPLLSPLAILPNDTLGHLPLANSPVIEGGSASSNTPATDQRGYPRVANGDNSGGALPDMGSIEATTFLLVTTNSNELDAPAGAQLSLREALRDATNGQRVLFSPSLDGKVINASAGLGFVNALHVDASALASKIIVSNSVIGAGGYAAIYNIAIVNGAGNDPPVGNASAFSAHYCDFLNHSANPGFGGAMQTSIGSSLFLNHCLFENNVARIGGGALHLRGFAVVRNTIFRDNRASGNLSGGESFVNIGGGAILSDFGARLFLDGCEISRNNAPAEAGGLLFASTVPGTIRRTTFTENVTGFDGAGIKVEPPFGVTFVRPAVLSLESCTLSGNLAGNAGGALVADSSQGVNFEHCTIVGNHGFIDSGGLVLSSNPVSFSQSTDLQNTDPLLGPLTWNGGPTRTHLPLA